MGRAVLQYSHCTSDTAPKLGARGEQARRPGHTGRKRARWRWEAGARGCWDAGAKHGRRAGRCDTAAGAATRPGGPATTRPDPPTTRPHARGHA